MIGGIPYISIAVLAFGLFFLIIKKNLGVTFRVKKVGVIIAVIILAVLFLPYRY